VPSLAEQLTALVSEWADAVVADAAQTEMVFTAQANCPVAPIDGGEMLNSIQAQPLGERLWEMSVDDRGFTDEGPEPHTIYGNPLLAFDWPAAGLFPAILAKVEWVPGPGVEMNRGWWSERTVTDDNWVAALERASELRGLGE
jgi:hypothetical protein